MVNKFFTEKLNENQEYFGVKKGSTVDLNLDRQFGLIISLNFLKMYL